MSEEKQFSLAGLIDQHIADSREDKEYLTWRASQMGKCLREHFLLRAGVKQTTPPDSLSQRKFAVGDVFHEYIQGVVLDNLGRETAHGKIVAVEVEVEVADPETDSAGRCDLVIMFEDGYTIMFDIKSMHSRAFWHLEKSGKTVKEKYPHYVQQLLTYMYQWKQRGTPVDEGRLLLVSKDDLCIKETTYYLTDELEADVLKEFATLNQHWAEKKLPPCTCKEMYLDKDGNSNGPNYCSYGVKRDGIKKVVDCCRKELYEAQSN